MFWGCGTFTYSCVWVLVFAERVSLDSCADQNRIFIWFIVFCYTDDVNQ